MQDEAVKFLNLAEQPGALSAEQTSWKTGFSLLELSILANESVLRPLGHPLPQNARRLYARVTVQTFTADIQALERARKVLIKYHRKKNESRRAPDAGQVCDSIRTPEEHLDNPSVALVTNRKTARKLKSNNNE